MKFQVIAGILVRILSISALALAACIPVAAYFGESVSVFAFSAGIAAATALVLHFLTRHKNIAFSKRESFLSVGLAWIAISFVGTLPYLISNTIPSFTDALFESVSGFSTTGASIFTDVESLPKSILFWRSLTSWIGGIGIIMLVIVVMPSLKMGNYQMFSMESSLQERVTPRFKSLGYRILMIYIFLTALNTALLRLGDMPLFDSLCHALSTMSSCGFSTKNASFMDYSPYIQYVTTLFMIFSGVNFTVFYFLFKGRFSKIRDNEELRYYLLFILVSGLIVAAILVFRNQRDLETALRESFFQIVSVLTTTGFSSADYLFWHKSAWVFIAVVSICGGCMGSTSGGIKMGKTIILIKNIQQQFRNFTHPNSVRKITLNKKTISQDENNAVISFIALYFLSIAAGSVILLCFNIDVQTAVSAVVSCIGCVGPGFGTVGPTGNFAHLPDAVKLLLSFFMILGRLEFYTILILFLPAFWKR
ncbi:potassium transporter [Bacteroidia bacterium]|nr:potassium transporter [Bacteroidia bacterium]